MDYKKELLKMLGLQADATDEQIASGCAGLENTCRDRDALKNRAESAEARVAQLEREKLEAQIEEDLETYKDAIANREEVKAALLANRDSTLKVMAALRKPAPEAPAQRPPVLLNRNAGTPAPAEADGERDRQREAFVEEVRLKNRCSKSKAFTLAASLKPELFR